MSRDFNTLSDQSYHYEQRKDLQNLYKKIQDEVDNQLTSAFFNKKYPDFKDIGTTLIEFTLEETNLLRDSIWTLYKMLGFIDDDL